MLIAAVIVHGGSEMNEIDRLLAEVAAYLTSAKAMRDLEVRAWYEGKAAQSFGRVLRRASLTGNWVGFTRAIDLQKRELALAG